MAGFYAQVVLYSEAWRQLARAAGDTPPFPGAPAEWTADQQLLWSLQQDYRAMASAVATWDGQLPETEILESPEAFREWFDDWMERRKHQKEGQSEEHGWVLK